MNRRLNEVELDYAICTNGVIFINTAYLEPHLRGQGRYKECLRLLQKVYAAPIQLESFHTLVPMYLHLGFIDIGEIDDQGYHLMRRDLSNEET